jgi:uncharacterized lipoprotein YddW (UPF0748 family)
MRPPIRFGLFASIFLSLFLPSCASLPEGDAETGIDKASISPISREFRGLWLASFMNIDWPSRPGLPASELQAEIDSILDSVSGMNMNAVILQVRPCGDSLYRSSIEPWSSYLSGSQGQEPDSGLDPLQAWIDSARLRGIRLFAWVNPFRVGSPSVKSYAANSAVLAHPDLVRALGQDGYRWLDPGMPEARAYAIDVIKELIEKYDIDGIFIDDYFYPSREQMGGLKDFPDEGSFAAYRSSGGDLSKPDWRRRNTEIFVRDFSLLARTVKPGLPVGISPAGIWRPGFPAGIRGRDAYAESFADSRSWLERGYADIFSPQLYWPIAQVPQSFPLLLRFWIDKNSNHTKILPSLRLGIESVEEESRVRESLSQIMVERGMNSNDSGFILYGWKQLSDEGSALRQALIDGPLADTALPPAFPWLPGKAPAVSSFSAQRRGTSVLVEWQAPGAREIVLCVEGDGGRKEYRVLGPSRPDYEFKWPEGDYLKLSLRAVGLSGLEGPVLSLECLEYLSEDENASSGI